MHATLEGVPDRFDSPVDRAEFRRLSHCEGVELYRARIVHHAFDPHVHDAYAFGITDAGVQRFRYRGAQHLAGPGSMVLMAPDEVHTGRADRPEGWTYRMLYLDADLLRELSGDPHWDLKEVVVDSPRVAGLLQVGLHRLWQPGLDPLTQDGILVDLATALRPLVRPRAGGGDRVRGPEAGLQRALQLMRDEMSEPLRLGDLAQAADLSPFHFLRAFRRRFDATPHQMLMALRMQAAKDGLARGEAPVHVAARVGLADQAHLTRRFRGMFGLTPKAYQQLLAP